MPRSSPSASADQVVHISASAFKATCLKLMDDIARTGREVVVTKRGEPVVRISAAAPHGESPWGFLRGTIVRHGDVVVSDEAHWNPSPTDPLRRASRR